MNVDKVVEIIEGAVISVERRYQCVQGLILTESDLKCLIYRELYEDLSSPEETTDGDVRGIPLHAEVRWYDDRGKLLIIPDITILEPCDLSIKHGVSFRVKGGKVRYGRLPSKNFEFRGKAIVIEIKFIRERRGISREDILRFEKDVCKIGYLRSLNSALFGILLIFNKTNGGKFLVDQFSERYRNIPYLKIIYGTGNVKL